MTIRLLALLCAVGCSISAHAGDPRNQPVLAAVKQLAATLSDGPASFVEGSEVIRYAALPSSLGAISNAVVLFNVESFGGGNNSHQFLAVFAQGSKDGLNPDWPFNEWRFLGFTRVGKDWERLFSGIEVRGNDIVLTGTSWVEKRDAHCCPSGSARAVFRFAPYSLLEVNMAANQPLHPTPSAAGAAASAPGERRR